MLLYTQIINIHIYTYTCRIHLDARIKTSEDFLKNIPLTLFERVCKGLLKVLLWEGVGDRTEMQHIDPHSYGHQCCVNLVLQRCSTGGLVAHSAGCRLPLPHLVTNGSGLQTNWLPVFTELCNSSIAHLISPHNWPSRCVTSAVLGMACLIVIERK